jgi:hypothetical protein
MSVSLNCWKCGHALDEMPMPLRRRDECPACATDLHVCRMCEFYDTSVAKSCREPVAEEVTDKERANFCDYFRGQPGVQAAGGTSEAEAAKARLEAMFGIAGTADDAESPMDRKRKEAEDARKKLDELFGDSDKSE